MNEPIKLWGTGTTRTIRPIWVAEELGLSYQLAAMGPRTGETKTEFYTQLNPKQKIPFMKHGEVRLAESVAISRYLIEAYPSDEVFLPSTIAERAILDDWVCHIYGELDETSLYVMRRHGDLSQIYGASEVAVTAAREYATGHLQIIEAKLRGREFVMSQGFSLADVMLISCLLWALTYEFVLPQGLQTYYERIQTRQAFQKAVSINFSQTNEAEVK